MQAKPIHFVSGDCRSPDGQVRLRLETDDPHDTRDFLIAPDGLSALVSLLLVLGKERGLRLAAPDAQDPGSALPIPVDAVSVGETSDGDPLVQIDIGLTALAFALPQTAAAQLGRALLALSATAGAGSA